MERKIACLNKISDKGLAALPDNYSITKNQEEAHGWLVRSAKLHDTAFPAGLRAIARAGAGVNNIPLDRCAEQGIVVFNTPGANANAVSELVISTMILSVRDILGGMNWVRSLPADETIAAAVEKGKGAFVGNEIRGKTLGIIGLGAIGHMVANAAVGMGMKVLGFDPAIPVQYAWRMSRQVKHIAKVEELLPQCDFLTVHVPLNDKTKNLLDTREIAMMKHGAVLLNFSRDVIVNEEAVQQALEDGKLRAYVVDFPNPLNINFPHTLVVPHLGASTEESEENCATMAVDELRHYLDEGNIKNSVNFPAVSLGPLTAPTRVVVLHRNQPKVITKISGLIGDAGYNIEQMVSGSRGAYSCAIFDITTPMDRAFPLQLEAEDDILKVRVIQKEA